jgi:two-component system response regulator RegX3
MSPDSLNILVVEDEPGLQRALVDLLGGAGHQVDAVGDGESAVEAGLRQSYDLILLDLMLPRMDGLDVCRKLREVRPALPILMLTARGAEEDKVNGLVAGADDYVTKPFGAKELLARVQALRRRARVSAHKPDQLQVNGTRFDLGRCTVWRGEEPTHLTQREVGILRWLYNHRARAVSRAELLEEVWGMPGDLQTRTVDMTISNLRQKIESNPSRPEIIVTVKGVGYAWGDRTDGPR